MLLDSTFLIHLEREERARAGNPRQRRGPFPAHDFLAHHGRTRFKINVIAIGEFYAGCEDAEQGHRLIGRFRRVIFTEDVARFAGRLEREQRRRGVPLGENDNWLAAHALLLDRVIVSRDKAFDAVPRLDRRGY